MTMRSISLQSLLASGRPHGGRMEKHLRGRIQGAYGGTVDHTGNLCIAKGESHVLFSAHLDTVHRTDGYVGFRQKGPTYSALKECLGADDGAGIWMLLQMIAHDIPGTYVFTVGEEVGAVGASGFLMPPHIKACVSFDRKGTTDVVYVQGTHTGSLKAAQWVCDALEMEHKPSTGGTFSDNAIWASDVPECLNISVGYANAHTALESLDTIYLHKLLEVVLSVQWDQLPIVRDPTDDPYQWPISSYNMGGQMFYYTSSHIEELVRSKPDVAARMLQQHVDPEELFWEFMDTKGCS